MSEQNKDAELRQIVTDALVSMVSGVTGLVPPTGPGQIPDFIQAPIDRAVEKISASLPVGVPDELREARVVGFKPGMGEVTLYVGRLPAWLDMGHACYVSATPTFKAEQVQCDECGGNGAGGDHEDDCSKAHSLPAAGSADLPPPDFALDGGSQPCYYEETVQRIVDALSAQQSAHVSVPRELPGIADRLERFIETVRGCERLASDYSGSIDGVDEHGGDDHDDPICAAFHRLYYAMFDGDKLMAELRALLNGGEA
jgi:hypothetical protein